MESKSTTKIYFTVSKASRKGTINLFVQSAYTRDKGKRARQQKPISFSVILFNTLNKIAIRQQ